MKIGKDAKGEKKNTEICPEEQQEYGKRSVRENIWKIKIKEEKSKVIEMIDF